MPLQVAGEPTRRARHPARACAASPGSAFFDHAGLRLRQCRPRRSAACRWRCSPIRCRSASWPASSSASRSASSRAPALADRARRRAPAGGRQLARSSTASASCGGIGFTMSLFIGTLAFPDDATREAAGAAGRAGRLAAVGGRWAMRCCARNANPHSSGQIARRLGGPILSAMRRTSYEQMNCSIASALDVVGEPWTLLIVRDAFYGVRRFDDFQENLGIARNVLTARLKKLVEAGVFRKTAYRQRPLRHEYRLTDKGAALFTVIVGLKQWGDRYRRGRAQRQADGPRRPQRRPAARAGADRRRDRASGSSSPTCAPWPGPAPTRARATSSTAWRSTARRARRRFSLVGSSCLSSMRAGCAPRASLSAAFSRLGAAEAPAVGIGLALALASRLVLAGASSG